MHSSHKVLAALLALGSLAALSSADDKKGDKEGGKTAEPPKVVGKWSPAKGADLPDGAEATIEFTKDGKVRVDYKSKDQSAKMEGTYEVKGEKMTLKLKDPSGVERTNNLTILKLTDKELETKDSDGKVEKFDRK